MRSLFWRILATFWLAIALVAGLAMLLGHALNQDAWILNRHPGVNGLAEVWTKVYERQGPITAQFLLERHRNRYGVDVQVLAENGQPIIRGTFPARAAAFEARQEHRDGRHHDAGHEQGAGRGDDRVQGYEFAAPVRAAERPERKTHHHEERKDRKSTRLNSSHMSESRMPSSA